MDEVNYNDTVVVPYLEKKCKDLLSLNLVLEAKLLIEQSKVKNFENFANKENEKVEGLVNQLENAKLQYSKDIESLKNQHANDLEHWSSQLNNVNQNINSMQNEKNSIESERNNLLNQVNALQSQVAREQSLKDNAISEYHNLNAKYSELEQQLTIIKNENLTVCSELEQLKKKISEPKIKKQQQSQVI